MEFYKKGGKKLDFQNEHVTNQPTEGFKGKDCKFFLCSHHCLLTKDILESEMSCAFCKKGNGIEIKSILTNNNPKYN
jgi:hypothetical protein